MRINHKRNALAVLLLAVAALAQAPPGGGGAAKAVGPRGETLPTCTSAGQLFNKFGTDPGLYVCRLNSDMTTLEWVLPGSGSAIVGAAGAPGAPGADGRDGTNGALPDPGANGVMVRTALNTTAVVSGSATNCVLANGTATPCLLGGNPARTGQFDLGAGTVNNMDHLPLPGSFALIFDSGATNHLSRVDSDGATVDLQTPYSLPTASANTLGGAKVGTGLAIDGAGVLSATATGTLPAQTNKAGHILVSDGTNAAWVDVSGVAGPGAPTAVTGTPGSASVSLALSAPASAGWSAVLGYSCLTSPGSFTGTASASPVAITGLSNGTEYTATCRARNAFGYGTASSASAGFTPVSGEVSVYPEAIHYNAGAANETSFATLPTVGDAIYVVFTASQGTADITAAAPTDNQGNTYAIGVQASTTGSPNRLIAISCAIASTSAGTFTVTQGFTGAAYTYSHMVLYRVPGGTCTLDTSSSKNHTPSIDPPWDAYTGTVTTTNAATVVFSAISTNCGSATCNLGPSTGFTLGTDQQDPNGSIRVNAGAMYRVLTSTATLTPQFTSSTNGTQATAAVAAYRTN